MAPQQGDLDANHLDTHQVMALLDLSMAVGTWHRIVGDRYLIGGTLLGGISGPQNHLRSLHNLKGKDGEFMLVTKYSLSDIPEGSDLEEDLLNRLKMGELPNIAELPVPDETVELDFRETPPEEWVMWAAERGVDLSQYRDDPMAEPWRVIDRTMNSLNDALDRMAHIPNLLDMTPQERHQLKDLCTGLFSVHDKVRNLFLSLEWLDDETKEELEIFMD